MAKEAKRPISFERQIIKRRPDDVEGWIEATLDCGHLVSYCTPSVEFKALHCGECVNEYLRKAREEQARLKAAEVGAAPLDPLRAPGGYIG